MTDPLREIEGDRKQGQDGNQRHREFGHRLRRRTYAAAGVDIDAGNRMVELIKPLVRATARAGPAPKSAVSAGCSISKPPVSPTRSWSPRPTASAQSQNCGRNLPPRHDRHRPRRHVGQRPRRPRRRAIVSRLLRLRQADPAVGAAVVKGVAAGCREAGCALIGGERRKCRRLCGQRLRPRGLCRGRGGPQRRAARADIEPGDVVVGLAATGVHSSPAPFERSRSLGEALLTPTRLYVRSCLAAIRTTKAVKALAHITGGGFTRKYSARTAAGTRRCAGACSRPGLAGVQMARQCGAHQRE